MITPTLVFAIILAIVIADFAFERWLDYLNTTRWSDVLPEELCGIYDEKAYQKSQQYQHVNHRFGMITSTVSFVALLAMLWWGGFAWLDAGLRQFTENPIWLALLFFGVLAVASSIISLPFSIYDTFVIEARFGFNKTTPRTFVLDLLKGALLGAVVGGGLLALIVWIYLMSGSWFWLIAWGVVVVFSIFMTLFYSNLIVPFFNKQTPLAAGELRDAIEKFAARTGFHLKNIYVIDGSRRSTKANAYFTGLGAKKRIVLYDSLIEKHTTDELVAVLAHEIGHYKKKHTLLGLLLGIAQTGITFFLLSLFLGEPVFTQALGVETHSFHIAVLAFGLIYAPVSLVTGIAMNIISRRNEFAADRFAAVHFAAPPLMTALKRLSADNLSNLRPHPAVVFVHYSHPPLLQRLAALESLKN
jgi:STE24 endopeptidase